MTKFTHVFCITAQSGEFSKNRRATLRKWARRNGLIIDWIFGECDQKSHMAAIDRVATISNIIAVIMEEGVLIERAVISPPPLGGAIFLLEHNIFNLHPSQPIPAPGLASAHIGTWLRTPRLYYFSPHHCPT